MGSFVGIDLGTSFSAVATIDETGRPVIVHNADGKNLTPSCVTASDGRVEVGEYARRTWGNAPEKAAARFKREMGTAAKHMVNGHEFTPTDLSTLVLKKLAQDAFAAIGELGEVVVTIPANFAHEAREATMRAAKNAGLNVRYIINEPTAAALYYAFKSGEQLSGNYAVYDLGGGTFDVSIIHVEGHDVDVLATNGVAKLGGDDFDDALIRIVKQKYEKETGRKFEADDFTKNDAEEQKKSLASRKRVTIKVGKELIDVTREELDEAISSLVTQAEMLCEATLDDAELEPSQIEGVFLAGGSTRWPSIQESVTRVFRQKPLALANVDEVVALGAALYAAYKGDRATLTAAQRTAIQRIKVLESTSKCFGTISLSFDVARDRDIVTNNVLIRKGEKIPCSVTQSFLTVREGQTEVMCKVTESTSAESDPRFVKVIWEGQLSLPSNRPAKQEIKVTFSYDQNQIMKCAFEDTATGRQTKVDLSMTELSNSGNDEVEKFLVL